ncbi:MAG: 3-dehydroquinate synthase [Bacteroidetes bacterium]|nr:MAG: 3-dehydroquinate synthase [Bacteroidota bacterium]
MTTLSLPTYDICIGPFGDSQRTWLHERAYAGLVVLTDTNTRHHCWPLLREKLAGMDLHLIEVPPGEIYKTLDTARRIWQQLFELEAGRRWCMLNLGGGVIGDMGGFCAGTYKRGIDFIQLPTTLLSQVDASVGGKLGIDFYGVKNAIGMFQNPVAVWADPLFFDTLPARELRSGFAEIVKHALIRDAAQWAELVTLTDLTHVNWADWVARSVAIKKDIVLVDPYEDGLRKALNFGHTIGHAVESYFLETDTPLLHGEAIAIGMIAEAYLSQSILGLSAEAYHTIAHYLIHHYGHRQLPESSWPTLLATMRQDKKNETAAINFSLLPRIGQVLVNQTASAELIKEALLAYNNLSG